MELLRRRPAHAPLLDWRRAAADARILRPRFANEAILFVFALLAEGSDSPFLKEALPFTAFGLDEFRKRTERDGATLAILAIHRMRRFGDSPFARMNAMAEERGIPVIDQGAELREAEWAHDSHWSPAGHQWAAEALLEYLKENQDICEGPALSSGEPL